MLPLDDARNGGGIAHLIEEIISAQCQDNVAAMLGNECMLNKCRVWMAYLVVVVGVVGGQTVAAQPPGTSIDRKLLSFWEVVALQRYRVSSDVEQRRGSLGFSDSELRLGRSQLTPVGILKLSAAYTYTHFDFANDTDLGLSTAKPFETVHDVRATLQFSTRLSRHWLARIVGAIGTRVESGAEVDDAIYGRFALGISYRVSDQFTIGTGLFIRRAIDDDVTVLPIPLIDWAITDRLFFRSRRDFRLSYVLDDRRRITLSAVASPFDRKAFRLDDEGVVPGGIATFKSDYGRSCNSVAADQAADDQGQPIRSHQSKFNH